VQQFGCFRSVVTSLTKPLHEFALPPDVLHALQYVSLNYREMLENPTP
jgi:hypothetical protein